jgi:hypothetical protein
MGVKLCLSYSLIQKHTLWVFENRVLRRLFETKKDGVTGGIRKFHNEDRRKIYFSPDVIRMMKSRNME